MPETLLTILKFLLVALLYLFFFRVLRAVWAEVHTGRGPAPAANPTLRDRSAATARPPARLKVVEPKEQRGRTYALSDQELTLGRAAGCGVRLEDNFTSQLHARIYRQDGQFFVEDLGSTNGTYVNRKGTKAREKVAGPQALRTGDRLIVGRTVLEVTR